MAKENGVLWCEEVGLLSAVPFSDRIGAYNDYPEVRADFLVMKTDYKKREHKFIIYEVKSCAEDYKQDTKWHHYLKYCHRLYFVVKPDFPIDIIDASHPKVGIAVTESAYSEDVPYGYRVVKKARWGELDPKVEPGWLHYLVTKRLFHGGRGEH